MSGRDRNMFAWQAYVIAMSIVSALMLVGLFFLWNYASTQAKEAETAKASASNSSAELGKAKLKSDRLLSMLGQGNFNETELETIKSSMVGDPQMEALEKSYDTDMSLLGANVEAANKNYAGLAKTLMDVIKDRNIEHKKFRDREDQLRSELTTVIDRETKRANEAEKKRDELATELSNLKTQYQDDRTKLTGEMEQLKDRLQKANDRYSKLETEKKRVEDTLTAEVAKLKDVVAQQAAEIVQLRYEDFDTPQGKIVNVTEGGSVVWINIGKRAGLKENVRFAVLGSDTLKVTDAKEKAKIIITKVVDNDLAQARVIEGNIKQPILPGDFVYSPAWQPGRKVHFALVGLLDADGDGRDDRETIKNLIALNGGEVDFELTAEGRVVKDQMSINTRYLVVGPSGVGAEVLAAGDSANTSVKKLVKDYNAAKEKAKELGVIEISVEKLLSYLQGGNADKTIPLGAAVRASDFRAEDDDKKFFRRPTPGVDSLPNKTRGGNTLSSGSR